MMFYPNLKIPTRQDRPTFYSNFVSTLDGKVAGYWPIGSKLDYEVLIELRSYADALVHGKTTASLFPTVQSLAKQKNRPLYIVVSASPDLKLVRHLKNSYGIRPLLATTERARLPVGTEKVADVVRFGKNTVDLKGLAKHLSTEGIRRVLVEGGPRLLGSFFAADLVDEIFLTLAPKIFGGEEGKTQTMVEGMLFPPGKVKRCALLSAKKGGDELFLRYRIIR